MTDKQPKALRLAAALMNDGDNCTCAAYSSSECGCGAGWADQYAEEAAAELRRLHEVNVDLVEAIANLIKVKGRHNTEIAYQRLVSAYDKATGEQS